MRSYLLMESYLFIYLFIIFKIYLFIYLFIYLLLLLLLLKKRMLQNTRPFGILSMEIEVIPIPNQILIPFRKLKP